MATEPSSIPDDTEIFRQLEHYPWSKDKEFQGGLSAILGPSPSPSQVEDLTIRAQCFYLSRKKSIPIDFDAYKSYLANKSGNPSTAPSTVPQEPHPDVASSSKAEVPQLAGTMQPQPHPHHESDLPPATMSTDTSGSEKTAPYPPTFAQIVELITTGAPIPGIKDIPPTLLTSQITDPQAPRRRKPWEKDVPDGVIAGGIGEGTFGDARRDNPIEQELPEGGQ
ncbi:uncharacterized protein BP5553_02557 [Venustampulla echinocandica]|uniref:Uncharacterized protein n=1 Tax=Venustampulla echinocandica TaxID=2656787 RepID=A0A370TRQ7_9HELO|nr:uncharacterized protein BP5553_02557 [Venustampulla echinocandica]RDL38217.1 hypothetical protein BP5553_02557 [Venustampulla echinocandica]